MKKKKLSLAFGFFFALVGMSLLVGVMFLESQYFANLIKKTISERSPKSLGIVGDFNNVKLYFFPPGIGLTSPKVQVQKNNISKLPIEAAIEADELRFHFEPIQMLSGTLEVSKIVVKEGSVIAHVGADVFKPKPVKKKTNPFSWDELLELQINGIELENTFLSIEIEVPENPEKTIKSEFVVKHLVANKEIVQKRAVLKSFGLVNAVKLDIPSEVLRVPVHTASELEWNLELTDEGVNLAPLRLQLFGLELITKGKISGNLFDPKSSLNFELDGKLKSDLEEFFSANEISDDVMGAVEGSLTMQGDLKNIEKTLRGQYQISGKKLKWKDATAARLDGDGHLDLASNIIQIKNFRLFEKEGHEQGGEVQVNDGMLSLKSPLESLSAKVSLKDAPFHWIGGVVLKGIYPLRGEMSGSVEINSRHSQLEIKPDLVVKNFALTNQSYKKVKPMVYASIFPTDANIVTGWGT